MFSFWVYCPGKAGVDKSLNSTCVRLILKIRGECNLVSRMASVLVCLTSIFHLSSLLSFLFYPQPTSQKGYVLQYNAVCDVEAVEDWRVQIPVALHSLSVHVTLDSSVC